MADTKITALAAIATVDPAADVLPIVDISDTSMAASGTTKKVTTNQILGAGGTATLASAAITGAATVGTTLGVTGVSTFAAGTAALPALTTTGDTNTGIYYPAADTFAVTTGGTERYRVDSTGNVGIGVTPSAWASTWKAIQVGAIGSLSYSPDDTGYTISTSNGYWNGSNWIRIAAAAVSAYSQNQGKHSWLNAASSSAGSTIAFGDANMTLDESGNLLVGVTSANANGGVLQLKSGITFPATQVAASDANTLDDYEEGTFTATLKGGTTDPTIPVTATGKYTKIGRQVFVQIEFAAVSTVGASGTVFVTGLPFTSASGSAHIGCLGIELLATFTNSALLSYLQASSSTLYFYTSTSNSTLTTVAHNAGINRYLWAAITYTV